MGFGNSFSSSTSRPRWAGGFIAASDEVGISQPGLSLAVRALERELGVPCSGGWVDGCC
ncbi:MAG: LysR family transcriptional regulator [Acidimicrobiales bacterium]